VKNNTEVFFMNYEDVQKLSNAAKNKIGLLNGKFPEVLSSGCNGWFLY